MDRIRTGKADRDFLERCFHKLLINFAWWVNKVDREGNNVFEGGFLGLDNITVIDRSEKLPDGAVLEQSDATGWMGMFCLNLMRIALELAKENQAYEALATKFFQHYIYVGAAMKKMGGRDYQLWDEEDGFFYDVLRYPDGSFEKFRVRSLVGLIPLYAVERLEEHWIEPFAEFTDEPRLVPAEQARTWSRTSATMSDRRDAARAVCAIVDEDQMRAACCGASWTRTSSCRPTACAACRSTTRRTPSASATARCATSRPRPISKIKGGNSNWRGPVWFPTSFLMIESLRKLGTAFGPHFTVPAPTGATGPPITLFEVAEDLADRMIRIFTRDAAGRRPVYGRIAQVPGRPALARPASCSTSTSTATPAKASAPRTRPAGPASSPRSSTSGGGRRSRVHVSRAARGGVLGSVPPSSL